MDNTSGKLNNGKIVKIEVCSLKEIDEKIEELLDKICIDELSAADKAKIFKKIQERLFGFYLPGAIDQTLSFGGNQNNQVGVQVVEGNLNFNVFDAKIFQQIVEKMIEKDPEMMIRLAQIIAEKSR